MWRLPSPVFAVTLVIVMVPFIESIAHGGDATSVDAFLDRWKSASDDLWSFDIVLKVSISTKDNLEAKNELQEVGRYTSRQRFFRGLWRVDRMEELSGPSNPTKNWVASGTDIRAYAWDGKNVRAFSADVAQGNGAIVPIERSVRAKIIGPMYQELWRSDYFGCQYVELVRSRRHFMSRERDEIIFDVPAAVPGDKVAYAGSSLSFRFDATKGSLPKSIALFYPDHPQSPLFKFENVLREVVPGIWAPVLSQETIYEDADRGKTPSVLSKLAIEVDIAHSSFNVDIDPAVFRMPFPSGTVVYDFHENKDFIVASGGERDYAAYKAYIKEAVLKQSEHGETTARNWFWPLVNGLAIIVLAAGLLVRRMRARRRNGP